MLSCNVNPQVFEKACLFLCSVPLILKYVQYTVLSLIEALGAYKSKIMHDILVG